MPLGKEVDLGPGNIVKWQPRSPTKKKFYPQFLAYVCCGQMAGWIKIPHGMEVNLDPNNIVLDGDPPKGHTTSQFLAHVLCGQTAG